MVTKRPPAGLLANWLATPLILKDPVIQKQEVNKPAAKCQGSQTKWVSPTSSLHVFQFDVDVAVNAERQGGLPPGDHGGVDDTQRAAPHRLSRFF